MEKIRPEEREKYEKVHEGVVAPKSWDHYNKEIFLAEFKNGTKIENNLLQDSIIFSIKNGKKIKKLNLKSLLPKFYRMRIAKDV
jgi:hypothetical protein